MSKVQDASSILKVRFALSKRPHLHRAHLVTVCNQKLIAVHVQWVPGTRPDNGFRPSDFKIESVTRKI